MAEEPKRKLAVLLHADVVGSTALVQLNESLAHQRIQDTFRRFSETIVGHAGIAHEIRGDALVAEFAKASDALSASLAFQDANTAHNDGLADDVRPVVRVGIAMGEVVIADNTVTGEGIVLAQRLEQLAEPGGVRIQGAAYETVPKRLPFDFESLGERELKGFGEPVRVYSVRARGPGRTSDSQAVTDLESATLASQEKPSIAVLPFDNMSRDPEQEYFADGIAEDIITALSKFHSFLVVARNSSFTYKGKAVDVKDVARDLGVRYVVEGSVRKAGNRVRVTAQLIDVGSGAHVWAERYDRELDDIFLVQDEITRSIASAIGPEFESAEIRRTSRAGGQELTVWGLVMQARWHLGFYQKDSCSEAQKLLLQAAKSNDQSVQAYVLLAMSYWMQALYRWSDSVESAGGRALEAARRAVSLDSGDASAQAALGMALSLHQENEQAIEVLRHAVQLNPNLAGAHGWLGIAYTYACDFERGVESAKEAMRLSPRDLDKPFWTAALSFAAFAAHRYEETIDIATTMLRDKPDLPTALRHRAASLAWLGRTNEAQQDIGRLLVIAPDTSISQLRAVFSLGDAAVLEHWLEGLRMAGMPE